MSDNNFNQNKMPDGYRLNKWIILLSGTLFTFIGSSFWGSPSEALFMLILYLGISKILSGVGILLTSLNRGNQTRKWGLVAGVIDLVFGMLLLSSDIFQTAIILVSPFIIAAWALCRGVIMIIKAIKLRKIYKYWLMPLIIGVFAIFAASLMLTTPYLSLIGFVDAICLFLIFMGISLIIQFLVLLVTDRKD